MLSRYAPNFFQKEKNQPRPLAIKGTEGIVVNYAKCCHPIPGDSIVGFVSAGRGIVIHTEGCKNVAEYRDRPEKWIDVQWEEDVQGEFPVEIRVDVVNQRGVLATVASTIAELGANIEAVNVDEKDGRHTEMVFVIAVNSRRHLANIMRAIRAIERVVRITRTKG